MKHLPLALPTILAWLGRLVVADRVAQECVHENFRPYKGDVFTLASPNANLTCEIVIVTFPNDLLALPVNIQGSTGGCAAPEQSITLPGNITGPVQLTWFCPGFESPCRVLTIQDEPRPGVTSTATSFAITQECPGPKATSTAQPGSSTAATATVGTGAASTSSQLGSTLASSPVASSPVASSPVASSPVASSPVASSPVASSPVASSPVASSPVASSPVASSPVASSPVASSPVASSPVASSPVASSPVAASNSSSLPASAATSAHADMTTANSASVASPTSTGCTCTPK
ncbi:hypothetical protein PWT90_02192 [Aphanocladium album]|nr:hypothetical protein PWT90_02192 [Aphanocladium album]